MKTAKMIINRRKLVGVLAVLALAPSGTAWAGRERRSRERNDHDYEDDDYNYDDAYEARRSGDILPLQDILTAVRSTYPGEIIGVEFERDDGQPIYEVKVLQSGGRYLEIYVDARTGRIIKAEGE